MIRLLYISTARRPFTDTEIGALLAISRRNNAMAGITGLLVVGGRRFLQALEGPEDAVTATYQRIARDPRHYAMVQLRREAIVERAFGGWTMGLQQGGAASPGAPAETAVAELVAPIADETLRAYFTGFTAIQSAA